MLSVSIHSERSIICATVTGRLDTLTSNDFNTVLQPLAEKEKFLIADLSGCPYLSSSGIRSLLLFAKKLKAKGGGFILAGLKPEVFQVIELSGLHKVFSIFGTAGEAIEYLFPLIGENYPESKQVTTNETYRLTSLRTKPAPALFWDSHTIAGYNELGFAIGSGYPAERFRKDSDPDGWFVSAGKCAAFFPENPSHSPDFRVPGPSAEGKIFLQNALSFGMHPSDIIQYFDSGKVSFREFLEELTGLEKIKQTTTSHLFALALADLSPEKPSLIIAFVFINTMQNIPAGYPLIAGAGFTMAGARFSLENCSPEPGYISFSSMLEEYLTIENIVDVEPLDANQLLTRPFCWLFMPDHLADTAHSRLKIETEGEQKFGPDVECLIRQLYTDSGLIVVKPLHGGYSAQTFQVESFDHEGRKLRPTVLKVANREMIEREAGRCQTYALPFIFNNSAMVLGANFFGETGALRYNFVGISGEQTRLKWLTHLFETWSVKDLNPLFDKIFKEILKPWYGQPVKKVMEPFIDHDPTLTFFPMIEEAAGKLFSISSDSPYLVLEETGLEITNPYWFLKHEYKRLQNLQFEYFISVCHGDLNMQNILIDQTLNVYLIDFSETRPRSVVSDFARMEAIFMIEYAHTETPEELKSMMEFAARFYAAPSLDVFPENSYQGKYPAEMERNVAMIRKMREYALEGARGNTTLLPYILALLEWVLPIVSYRSATPSQKRFSVAVAGLLCGKVQELL